ncbi:MAG: hypothetical protein BWY64_02281 [bacterium ADurb.Bin363]|nr:MAG: hypothetical protein BWY64_02281 [bacterium ADurb.Bin363]
MFSCTGFIESVFSISDVIHNFSAMPLHCIFPVDPTGILSSIIILTGTLKKTSRLAVNSRSFISVTDALSFKTTAEATVSPSFL